MTEMTTQNLKEQRTRLRLELECKQMEQAKKLLETSALFGWFGARGSFADPEERMLNQRDGFIPLGSGNFHKTGSKYPAFENEQELAMIRDAARYISETNGYLIGVLAGLSAFVIGKGYTYRVSARKNAEPSDDTIEKAQAVIDEFTERTIWSEMEEEIFLRSRIDGEAPIRYFSTEGYAEIRTVEPDQITQPANTSREEWGYGVHVHPEDHYTVLGYNVSYGGGDTVEVLPHEMDLIKVNARRITRRGLSDLFSVGDVADGALKLLRHMQITAAIQSSIALIKQHAKTTKAQAEDFISAHAFATRYNDNGTTTKSVRYEPGTVIDMGANSEYKEPPLASKNTANFIEIVKAALRCVNTRWNAPEFITGDASNGNYSSLLVAESPFVRRCEIVQNFYKRRFLRVMKYVLRAAEDAGRLDKDTCRYVEVQAEAPSLTVRNKLEQAQVYQIEHAAKVRSAQTWAQEVGLDPEKEAQNIEEFNRLHPQQPQGGMPGMLPEDRRSFVEWLMECGGPGSGVPGPCPKGGFNDKTQSEKWGKSTFKDWKKGLAPEEKAGLKTYFSKDYAAINSQLRSGQVNEKFAGAVKGLDSAIAKSEIPDDMTVFRGIKSTAFLGKDPKEWVGKTMQDNAYMSTTTLKSVGDRFSGAMAGNKEGAVIEVKVPKGSKAAFLPAAKSDDFGEQELVFGRGSKLKISGFRDEGGKRIIEAEYVS